MELLSWEVSRTQLDKAMAAFVGKRPLRRDELELSLCL